MRLAIAATFIATIATACVQVPTEDAPDLRGADAGAGKGDDPFGGPLGPGMHTRALLHASGVRIYDVYVPTSAPSPAPVVFYFHPLTMDRYYLQLVGTIAKAEAEGFVAVYANGLGGSWNGGACCGPSNGADGSAPVDDVGFVRALAAEITDLVDADQRRLYATGFSNGGFLAHRLACDAADVFAAIASVSAVNGVEPATCAPSRPVPVLQLNGTDDALVPYDGGFELAGVTDGAFASAPASAAAWAQRNGCDPSPVADRTVGAATCETWSGCDRNATVALCTLGGAGHCWFDEPLCALGADTRDLSATDETWAFLSQHSL